jgi:hypothetical protein
MEGQSPAACRESHGNELCHAPRRLVARWSNPSRNALKTSRFIDCNGAMNMWQQSLRTAVLALGLLAAAAARAQEPGVRWSDPGLVDVEAQSDSEDGRANAVWSMRPPLLVFVFRGQVADGQTMRRGASAGLGRPVWPLHVGIASALRFGARSAGPASAAQTDVRPYLASRLLLGRGLTLTSRYVPRLTIPVSASAGAPGVAHRGEVGVRWLPADEVALSLRQTVEAGRRTLHEDGVDGDLEVASVLHLSTDLAVRTWSGDGQTEELQVQLVRQGGMGTSSSGGDARLLQPQLTSFLSTLRGTWPVHAGALSLTLQTSYNAVAHGSGLDEDRAPDPDSICVLAQVAYLGRLRGAHAGVGLGAASISSPDPVDPLADDRGPMTFMPTAALWLADGLTRAGHAIQYLVSGSLLPRVDRVTAAIAPRARASGTVFYLGQTRFRAAAELEASTDLAPRARQLATRMSLGYAYRRRAGLDLSARYQDVQLPSASGDGSLREARRWNVTLDLGFDWDLVR